LLPEIYINKVNTALLPRRRLIEVVELQRNMLLIGKEIVFTQETEGKIGNGSKLKGIKRALMINSNVQFSVTSNNINQSYG